MKEPKETEKLVFEPLHCSQTDDESIEPIEPPLHRSTPKESSDSNPRLSDRSKKSGCYLEKALAQRDDQLNTVLSAYESLVVAWQDQNDSGKDCLLKRLESNESYSEKRESDAVPESVVELIQQLAKQVIESQKDADNVRDENEQLRKELMNNRVSNVTNQELNDELQTWKDACNDARIEIESLKNRLSNCESEVKILNSEKKNLLQKLNRRQSEAAKGVPQTTTCTAQEKQLNQNICTLKRLVDKQQKVMRILHKCITQHSTPQLNASISSGLSSMHSSENLNDVTEFAVPRLKIEDPAVRLFQYDDSLITLSQLLIKSQQILSAIESSNNSNT